MFKYHKGMVPKSVCELFTLNSSNHSYNTRNKDKKSLFLLIYINDLPEISRWIKMVMYADDTTLYSDMKHDSTSITSTQAVLL